MINQERLIEIKTLIGGGLVRDVPSIRQAWIDYGAMLLECPFKQRRQIGEWVREQGLDFVEETGRRSEAKTLAELILHKCVKLDDCPYSLPLHVLQWLRKQAKGRILN
jgi:hypothetical protein